MVLRRQFTRRTIVAGGRDRRTSVTYNPGDYVPAGLEDKIPKNHVTLVQEAPTAVVKAVKEEVSFKTKEVEPKTDKLDDDEPVVLLPDEPEAPDVIVPETFEEVKALGIVKLKEVADSIGVEYPKNIKKLTLRKKVLIKLGLK